jgi:hypothetical protein
VLATSLVVVLYLAAAVAVYWNVWSAGVAHQAQIGPDTALNTWFLAWTPHALAHGLNPFFSAAANAPFGINVLDNTSELLLGLLAAPVTALFGPVATFNLLMTLALAGSATSAYFLARRFTTWRPAAFAAGLLFGFSPYMITESFGTHLHLTFLVLPPLILLVLHEVLVRRRWSTRRCGLALAGLVIAQFFISLEVLVTTAITVLVILVVGAVVMRRSIRERLGRLWRSALVAVVVIAPVLAYPVWFMVAGPGHISGPIQLVPQAYRADLFGLFVPDLLMKLTPFGVTTTADHFANSYSENGSYLGIPLVLTLAAGVLWLRRRPGVWVLALSGLAVFILSLGGALAIDHAPAINGYGTAVGRVPLPEAVFTKLGTLDNLIPVRFSAYVALLAGLLLALVLQALHERWAGRRPAWAGPALVALVCFIPLIPAAPLTSIGPTTVPPYFAGPGVTALGPGSVTLVLPFASEIFPEAQMWQIGGSHPYRFTLVGGYFLVNQSDRGGHVAYSTALDYSHDSLAAEVLVDLGRGQQAKETASLRARLRAQFHRWRVANVVVPLAYTPNGAATIAFLGWLLGPPSHSDQAGAAVWYRIRP